MRLPHVGLKGGQPVLKTTHTLALLPRAAVSVLALVLMVGGGHARAQPAAPAAGLSAPEEVSQTPQALSERQSVLLQAMILDPANLDIAFEYAAVSTLLGDYEAAVSTYERLLIFAPGLARLNLELGALYFQLGSYQVASGYLQAAVNAQDASEDIVSKANIYLRTVAQYQAPAAFGAAIVAGARYQSNANAAPGNRRVAVNGGSFLLDDTAVGQSDVSGFLAGQMSGSYDLGTQGDTIDADMVVYAARFAELVRLDTALIETTFGPGINLERFGIEDTSLGLYGIAAGVRLNHANYSGGLGLGARFLSAITPDIVLDGKLEWQQRWFNDTADYQSVSEQNGSFWRLAATVSAVVAPGLTVRSLVLADLEEGRQVWTRSREVGGGIGVNYRFASPIGRLPLDWSLDGEAGYVYRRYRGPDPDISTSKAQTDHEGWLRTGLSVPLRDDLFLGLAGELRRQYSNYDLATYSNASALVSLSKAF